MEKLDQTTKMGYTMNVFVDEMGKVRNEMLEDLINTEKPKLGPLSIDNNMLRPPLPGIVNPAMPYSAFPHMAPPPADPMYPGPGGYGAMPVFPPPPLPQGPPDGMDDFGTPEPPLPPYNQYGNGPLNGNSGSVSSGRNAPPRLAGTLIITRQVLHHIGRRMVDDTTIEIDAILTGSVHRPRIVAAIITIVRDTRRTPTVTDAGLRQTIDTRIAVMAATIGSRQIITDVAIWTGGVTTIVIAIAMVGTT